MNVATFFTNAKEAAPVVFVLALGAVGMTWYSSNVQDAIVASVEHPMSILSTKVEPLDSRLSVVEKQQISLVRDMSTITANITNLSGDIASLEVSHERTHKTLKDMTLQIDRLTAAVDKLADRQK